MWEEVVTVAEKMKTYEELQAELETYKTKYEAYKAENNVLKHDRVNRQAKNSVFLNLFARKEYQLALYRELFPEDTMITEDDIEMVTLENVLTIHPYNDLGLLARGKLIVLAEAQSTWSGPCSQKAKRLKRQHRPGTDYEEKEKENTHNLSGM